MKNDYVGTLHVYSQSHPHDDAVIVGTKDALVALRDAINRALEVGDAELLSFTNDGEGFKCILKRRDSDSFYSRIHEPYTEQFYGNRNNDLLDPRDSTADEE